MIPDRWYPVLESKKLGKKPVAVQRFGRHWVLWRSEGGRPVMMPGYCPHRGACLGQGHVTGGELVCPWHGFRFSAEGACTLMPCEAPDGAPPRPLATEPTVVREAHGLLWHWWGERRDDYPEVPWFDDVATEPRQSYEGAYELPYHYTRMVETNLDIHHTPFVHRTTVPGVGPRVVGFEATLDGDRISTRGELCREGRDHGMPFRDDLILPNLSLIELTAKLRLVACATPVDNQRSWVWFRYYQDYTDLPGLRVLLAWFAVFTELAFVQRQDWRIFAGMQPGTVDDISYHFVEADHGIALYRKRRRELLSASRTTAPATAV
jgi:nitrite reductase/ring-hydroxylating ferredoxin subunit